MKVTISRAKMVGSAAVAGLLMFAGVAVADAPVVAITGIWNRGFASEP